MPGEEVVAVGPWKGGVFVAEWLLPGKWPYCCSCRTLIARGLRLISRKETRAYGDSGCRDVSFIYPSIPKGYICPVVFPQVADLLLSKSGVLSLGPFLNVFLFILGASCPASIPHSPPVGPVPVGASKDSIEQLELCMAKVESWGVERSSS